MSSPRPFLRVVFWLWLLACALAVLALTFGNSHA